MRIVFMGTPMFSVPCLEMIINEGHSVLFAVTRPDKPAGRGRHIKPSPVKQTAAAYGIKVLQPLKMKDEGFLSELREASPDLIITVAFGKILPLEILDIPKLGCVNVHASLLPKYRGAAPLNWAIIKGETVTGVTTMFMNEGMDTGDIILSAKVRIGIEMTAGELHDILMRMGADLLKETLMRLRKGDAPRIPQDESEASYAPMLSENTGLIDWYGGATHVHNLVRGLNPNCGAYTYYKGKRMRIWKTALLPEDIETEAAAGRILKASRNGIIVSCGKGCVNLLEIQFDSARRIDTAECWHTMNVGECFAQK